MNIDHLKQIIHAQLDALQRTNEQFVIAQFEKKEMAADIIQSVSSELKNASDQIEKQLNFIQTKHDGTYQKEVAEKHAWFIRHVQNQISEGESLTDKIITFEHDCHNITANEHEMLEKELGFRMNISHKTLFDEECPPYGCSYMVFTVKILGEI